MSQMNLLTFPLPSQTVVVGLKPNKVKEAVAALAELGVTELRSTELLALAFCRYGGDVEDIRKLPFVSSVRVEQ